MDFYPNRFPSSNLIAFRGFFVFEQHIDQLQKLKPVNILVLDRFDKQSDKELICLRDLFISKNRKFYDLENFHLCSF